VACAGVVGGKKGVRDTVAVIDGVGNRVCVEINAGVTLALTNADGDKAGFEAFSPQPIRIGKTKSTTKIFIFILSYFSLHTSMAFLAILYLARLLLCISLLNS
jgi:hypothetical protein